MIKFTKMLMEEFLEQDLFSLFIQPVVDFRNDRVFNGEVLSRLNHPEYGMIFPDQFLPAIDALDLHLKFDRYIFQKACVWLHHALSQGYQIGCVSCNFSRKSLSKAGLASDLIRLADQYGIPCHTLAVEITEQDPCPDVQQFLDNLNQLKAAGFRIILDDFGDGVTSIHDLLNYPLDIVKMDRSLLLETDRHQGAIVYRGLVAMASQMELEVVCEGIETEAQNHFAQESGCHYGQGFLFSKPIPQEQVFEIMHNSSMPASAVEYSPKLEGYFL